MSTQGGKLFDLLPAVYRLKDASLAQSQNLSMGPLQSLLMLVEEQLAVLANDLDQLYDDQFIETCAPWVIPYIGGLIGYEPVHGIAPAVASPRAEVANTISFRRRKGTILVLEQLGSGCDRMGRPRGGVFQSIGSCAVHEKHPAPQLLHSQFAALAAACIHGHGLRCHGPQGRCPSHRGRARPLQHPEHWDLPLVAKCLQPHEGAGHRGGAGLRPYGRGHGFPAGRDGAVEWRGAGNQFVNPTQLTAGVPTNLVATTGTASITVVNPGNVTSGPLSFPINAPTPIIGGLSPSSATTGGPAFTLTVNGTGFLLGATVQWNSAEGWRPLLSAQRS